MSNTFYQGRYSVSNIQWKIIEPFLPSPKFGGRPALNSRTVFNAILWILGSGAAWRDLPEKYGNWNSIYHKFRNWIIADSLNSNNATTMRKPAATISFFD